MSRSRTPCRRAVSLDSTFDDSGDTAQTMDNLKTKIRHVPDFPKAGILFYDITTLLQDREGFRLAIDSLSLPFMDQGIDVVVGIESRGFIFGSVVADRIGAGFTPVRKPGKLPSTTVRASYDLEYGTDSLEIHHDGVGKGQRVLIVDDLLATGGTAKATTDLVKKLGGEVHALAFLIELVELNGRAKLAGERIHSVLQY
jgi:adenine phosphoribosyltransferase